MSSRYDCIRNVNPSTSRLLVEYSLIEDLSEFGGPMTRLEKWKREWTEGTYDSFEVATLVKEFVEKARANIRELASEYGFTNIISVK